eukprot:5309894-Pyramimonas_sp.AAC.1
MATHALHPQRILHRHIVSELDLNILEDTVARRLPSWLPALQLQIDGVDWAAVKCVMASLPPS